MKISKLFICLTFSLLLTPSFLKAQSISDSEIRNIALNESPQFLNNIPLGQEMLYGFENRDQFKTVTTGQPLQLLSLSSETLTPDNNTAVNLIPRNEWLVPIMVNNNIKAMITVAMHEGRYQAVDFGAKDFARELNSFKQIPGNADKNVSVLRIYRLQSDFLVLPAETQPGPQRLIIPMKSAQLALFNGASYNSGLKENVAMTLIQHKLKSLPVQQNNGSKGE
jgi:hypothetical protein